jgi:hypothetical protein
VENVTELLPFVLSVTAIASIVFLATIAISAAWVYRSLRDIHRAEWPLTGKLAAIELDAVRRLHSLASSTVASH